MRTICVVMTFAVSMNGAASGKQIRDLDAIDHGFISAAFQVFRCAVHKRRRSRGRR